MTLTIFLLQHIFLTILLDVDNAIYMTSAIEQLPFRQQKLGIIWGLFGEFVGRIAITSFFFTILQENKPLFTLLKIEFTPNSISLFLAGGFIFYKSIKELGEFFSQPEFSQLYEQQTISFPYFLLQMTLFNLLLSIDSIIVVATRGLDLQSIMVVFLGSAIARFFAIAQIAKLIHKYPSINIVILIFLILVGIELFLEGLWFNFPEELFNGVMIFAIIFTIIHQRKSFKSS